VVDGVSYAPHGLPDVPALGCDVYLFSAYKTYGPHQGIMVIRRAFGGAAQPGALLQRRHALQTLHPRRPRPCPDRRLRGHGRLHRRAPHGIMAGGGDFYAGRALAGMGVDPDKGVLRLSFVHYTTADEVDRLITALDQVL
jgi:selenocysteine lyase/cysteine desulfurase